MTQMASLKWANGYAAFGKWKAATVGQLPHHRWVVGDSTDERMKVIGDKVPLRGA
jgi:hypothetical protein